MEDDVPTDEGGDEEEGEGAQGGPEGGAEEAAKPFWEEAVGSRGSGGGCWEVFQVLAGLGEDAVFEAWRGWGFVQGVGEGGGGGDILVSEVSADTAMGQVGGIGVVFFFGERLQGKERGQLLQIVVGGVVG